MKLELGKLGSESDILGQKDAFHAPCILVRSTEPLVPGEHIAFVSDLGFILQDMVISSSKPDGIVDPFLKDDILPNTKFWMLLNPGTISNLTHNFQITIDNEDFTEDKDFEEECCRVEVKDDEPDECKVRGCDYWKS